MLSSLLSRLAVGLLDLLARLLPASWLLRLADGAGTLIWWLTPGRRRVVDENLGIAFGDELSAGQRRKIGRAACRGLARVVAEVAVADRTLDPERLGYHGDWEDLEAEHAAGRGGIVVTAHLGNWEVGALSVRRRGIPLRALARPLRNPAFERWLERRRGGAEALIRKTGGLRDAIRQLRGGGWVALLADQNAGRHGLFVPFFGLTASTYPTPALLAGRLGVPLYLGVCLRRPKGRGFDVHLERLPEPEDVKAATADLNRRVEAWIRKAPEQYNWAHRRWKTRPPGRDRTEPGQPSYARLWPPGHPKTAVK
ncbi:MAG: lysophospholipid acyltransferase family protein [Planctomycetota bacterium]|nr:lysophospholipid acyltransferase family protein [Planctomycetota bacterium]